MTGRHDDIGRSLFTDYLGLQDELTEQELDYLERTRRFVDHEVLPVIGDYWQRAEFPFELIAKMAELGIVGDGIEGYGCPQMSPTASGLINMELSRGDGSLGTFLGVQSGLAMRSIALLGSEAQKQRWLPGMAALEVIGAFALTEPEHGSDSVGLEASLHLDGDAYVLNGRKRWIGNGSIADVVVVWARDTGDGAVKGLLLERGTPGFQAEVMQGLEGLLTAGHTPGHQSFAVELPHGGSKILTCDAGDLWENFAEEIAPGETAAPDEALPSIRRLKRIAAERRAELILLHDPNLVQTLRLAPECYD